MRMTVKIFGVIAALGLLLAAVPAVAHHSFAAAFDENHPINLQGTVTKVMRRVKPDTHAADVLAALPG